MVELRTRRREMRRDEANHHEELGLREFRVQVNLPSPKWQVGVPIWCVITPIRGLPNLIREVVRMISHIRSYPPHCSCLHPPSLSFSYTTLSSSQKTKLSHPSLSLHAMIMSWHWVQHTLSTTYTKHSIHRVQDTPSTAFSILMITSWPLNVASASGVPPYMIDHHQPARQESSNVKSPCHISTFASQLSDELSLSTQRAVHRPPPSTRPISLDYCIQLRTMIAPKCISILVQSRPPSVSPNTFDYGLQVRTIMACKCICKLARSWSQSGSLSSLDHSLQVHLQTSSIMNSECISKFTQSWPPSVSPNTLDYRLQRLLQPRSITISEFVSEFISSCFSGELRLTLTHRPQPVEIYRV